MDKRGHVAKNVERVTSGSRDYLRSEKQLWARFDLIKKDRNKFSLIKKDIYLMKVEF